MEITLKKNETVADLQRKGYKIIQSSDGFCFGMDAVLLSGIVEADNGETVVDLGTGTGILPILIEAKTNASKLYGLEIQKDSVDMARRSVEMNDLESKIEIVEGDIKEASTILGKAMADIVVTNPPYMEKGTGLSNPESAKAIARHEVFCTLEDVIREAAALLKPKGKFYMINRPRRLADSIELMKKYKVEPKSIRIIYPFVDKEANLFLIEGARGMKPMLKVKEPLIVYEDENKYTEEVLDIYGR